MSLDLTRLHGLRQPDHRSCGPTSVLAAQMLIDPAYAPASPAADVLALHRRLTSSTYAGRAQVPWPRALGTPPWAVAAAMTELAGVPYRTRVVRLGDRRAAYDAIAHEVVAGRPVPVYVGSSWLPRHVVLAVGPSPRGVRLFDPATGGLAELTSRELASGRLTWGRWPTAWFVVAPRRQR